MCCTVEGSHQLGSRSRHMGAASNPCLIFRSIILPAALMPGIGFRLAHLQKMTISCTQGIRSIHEFRHILVTDVQHPLQHARHLLLGSLSLSRNGHLDFQRGILMNRHIMMVPSRSSPKSTRKRPAINVAMVSPSMPYFWMMP